MAGRFSRSCPAAPEQGSMRERLEISNDRMPPPGPGTQRQPQVKLTTSAFATTIVLAVIPFGSQIVSALAASPPKLNISSSCDAAAKGAISAGRDKEACIGGELAAQEMLAKNLGQYFPGYKAP